MDKSGSILSNKLRIASRIRRRDLIFEEGLWSYRISEWIDPCSQLLREISKILGEGVSGNRVLKIQELSCISLGQQTPSQVCGQNYRTGEFTYSSANAAPIETCTSGGTYELNYRSEDTGCLNTQKEECKPFISSGLHAEARGLPEAIGMDIRDSLIDPRMVTEVTAKACTLRPQNSLLIR